VVVWRTLRVRGRDHHETVYACWRRLGRPHRIASFVTGAHRGLSKLRAAGHFVAFLVATDPTVTYLEVFDVPFGHTLLSEVSRCEGHSACPGFPTISAFALAPTGWIAQRQSTVQNSGETLLAVHGSSASVPLDIGLHIRRLSVRGSTLRWTSDDGARPSAPLSRALGPSASGPSPAPGACALVTAREAQVALGPLGPGGVRAPDHCVYRSATTPVRTLEITERTGLSADQVRAGEMDAESSHELERSPPADGLGGPGNQVFSGQQTTAGVVHQRAIGFFGSTKLTVDFSPAHPSLDLGVQRPMLIAAGRLVGLRIRRGG
jgi:hypothetical protein